MSIIRSYCLNASEPGPYLLVFGGIHGEEPCGFLALNKFISEMHRLKRGTLTLVPACNPQALERAVTFIDANLNRSFKLRATPQLYEEKIVQELIPLIDACDILIDFHSFTADGNPYLFLDFATEENIRLAKWSQIPQWIEGWPALYEDNNIYEGMDTSGWANSRGKSSITIECGQHKDPAAPIVAYEVLRRILNSLDMLPYTEPQPELVPLRRSHISEVIYKSKEGHFTKNWKNFSPVIKGDALIAYNDGSIFYAPYDGFIILPRAHAEMGQEWLYLGHSVDKY